MYKSKEHLTIQEVLSQDAKYIIDSNILNEQDFSKRYVFVERSKVFEPEKEIFFHLGIYTTDIIDSIYQIPIVDGEKNISFSDIISEYKVMSNEIFLRNGDSNPRLFTLNDDYLYKKEIKYLTTNMFSINIRVKRLF